MASIELAPGVKIKDDGTVDMSGVNSIRLPDGSLLLADGTVLTAQGNTQVELDEAKSKEFVKVLYGQLSGQPASTGMTPSTQAIAAGSAEDFIGSGPPTESTTTDAVPIGVPEGFTARRNMPVTDRPDALIARFGSRETQVKPRYWAGVHDMRPFSWSPGRVRQLQDDLVTAGLLTDDYRRGIYDASTKGALEQLLGYANATGQTMDEAQGFLAQHTDMALGLGGGGGGGLARKTVVSDPEGLKRLLRNTAEDLGIDTDSITPEVEETLVRTIQGMERGAQQAVSGEVVQPDAAAQVTKILEERYGQQIARAEAVAEHAQGRKGFLGNVLAIDRLIGGSGA